MENFEQDNVQDESMNVENNEQEQQQAPEFSYFGAEDEENSSEVKTFEDEDFSVDENEDSSESGESASGNQVFDQFRSWAESKGFELDESNYDVENFSKENVEDHVSNLYLNKSLDKIDPNMKYLIENKMSFEEYNNHQALLDQKLSMPKDQMIKSAVYNDMYNRAVNDPYSSIKPGEDGKLSNDQQKQLMQNVEDYYSKLSNDQVDKLHNQFSQELQEQKNGLPKYLQEQRMKAVEQEQNTYQGSVDTFIEETRKTIDKQNNFIAKFSAQSEKEDFIKHASEMLSITEVEGEKVVPLIHKLQTDDQFMLKVLRLTQLDSMGYFNDIKNKQRKAAFEDLNLTPNIGISSRKGNQQSNMDYFGA